MEGPRVAIIGAGPCGLACAKNLLQVGLRNFVVYERDEDVGGNWRYSPDPGHSSAYESLCAITSKRMSGYADFPMPEDYPDYPDHALLWAYFRAYARRFGLYDFIRFRTEVRRARPTADGGWILTLSDGSQERFDALMVANGHHWDPLWPERPGSFEGIFLHSHFYKSPRPFEGKRALVMGAGNSGCDIAVDVSRVARFTAISMRRGYHVIPKFVWWGIPADVVYARMQWIPRPIRQRLIHLSLWLLVGPVTRYGLPRPDHAVFETHPVINSELLYRIRHGKIHPRPDVARFEGSRVVFVDGRAEEYDAVIAATGYRISFPFLDPEIVATFLPPGRGEVRLYLHIFHPHFRNLFFIGLLQPNGCLWNLADLQARLVANFLIGKYRLPDRMEEAIAAAARRRRRRYVNTPRHTLEVDWHEYRRLILRQLPPDAPPWRDEGCGRLPGPPSRDPHEAGAMDERAEGRIRPTGLPRPGVSRRALLRAMLLAPLLLLRRAARAAPPTLDLPIRFGLGDDPSKLIDGMDPEGAAVWEALRPDLACAWLNGTRSGEAIGSTIGHFHEWHNSGRLAAWGEAGVGLLVITWENYDGQNPALGEPTFGDYHLSDRFVEDLAALCGMLRGYPAPLFFALATEQSTYTACRYDRTCADPLRYSDRINETTIEYFGPLRDRLQEAVALVRAEVPGAWVGPCFGGWLVTFAEGRDFLRFFEPVIAASNMVFFQSMIGHRPDEGYGNPQQILDNLRFFAPYGKPLGVAHYMPVNQREDVVAADMREMASVGWIRTAEALGLRLFAFLYYGCVKANRYGGLDGLRRFRGMLQMRHTLYLPMVRR